MKPYLLNTKTIQPYQMSYSNYQSANTPSFTIHKLQKTHKIVPIFQDVKNQFAASAINELYHKGIIKGYPDATFRPNEPLKRHHLATMIANSLSLKAKVEFIRFTDVSAEHPSYAAVHLLQIAGLIASPSGKFYPNATLSRAQVCKLLVAAAELSPGGTTTFKDIVPGCWSQPYIATLADLKIINGTSSGKFFPNAVVTRGQFACMLAKTLRIQN